MQGHAMTALAWVRSFLGFDGPSLKDIEDDSRIRYSPELIPQLKDDHAGLLRLHGQIEALAMGGRFAEIAPALRTFKSKFDLHTLTENVKFYCYLEENLGRKPGALRTIREFRREMNTIARGVVNFVRKYQESGVTAANGAGFLTELRAIGALLVQRVQREEHDLYPLYATA
jgi:hypothetical protein